MATIQIVLEDGLLESEEEERANRAQSPTTDADDESDEELEERDGVVIDIHDRDETGKVTISVEHVDGEAYWSMTETQWRSLRDAVDAKFAA